ncbi:MAG: SDR family NAD(P)-dependent oxidoreductase [Spirochaetes bacterium]|nr:SDR family NAD(P)-dependent oxidoreductase [Spirochaetota bacterium]
MESRNGRMRGWAAITGASGGLGKSFAQACARRGYDLFLADLPGTGLSARAADLTAEGADVRALEGDLSTEEGRSAFLELIRGSDLPLSLLVNNVGAGVNGLFDALPFEAARMAVELNIGTTMALTHGLVPLLASRPGSTIITVASLAAFYPMPLFAVYSSTKAFLLNWSLALRQELADIGVGVTVLTPGGMYTNEETREKVKTQGLSGRLSTMEPDKVADFALDAAERGKAIAIPGLFNKLLWFAGSKAPKQFVAASIKARWEKAMAKVPGEGEACFRR